MKILHIGGFSPVTKALGKFQMSQGHEVKMACLSGASSFLDVPPALSQMSSHIDRLAEEGFEIVAVHRPECFLSSRFNASEIAKLLAKFKMSGSKLVYYDYGCDSREEKQLLDSVILEQFDHVMVGRADMLPSVSGYYQDDWSRWSWLPLGAEHLSLEHGDQTHYENQDSSLSILHIPKGTSAEDTDYIAISMAVFQRMGIKANFRIVEPAEIKGFDDLLEFVRDSDIVIEQVSQKSYGLVGAIALAMGKVVLSGNAPEVFDSLESSLKDCPVVNVDRENLNNRLVEILWNREECSSIAEESRAFASNNHDVAKVGQRSLQIFEEILASGPASEFEDSEDPVVIEETAADLSNPKPADAKGEVKESGQVAGRAEKECSRIVNPGSESK